MEKCTDEKTPFRINFFVDMSITSTTPGRLSIPRCEYNIFIPLTFTHLCVKKISGIISETLFENNRKKRNIGNSYPSPFF